MSNLDIILVGDSPQGIGGLSRIARDVGSILLSLSGSEGFRLQQLALNHPGLFNPWPCVPIRDVDNWAEADVFEVLRQRQMQRLAGPVGPLVFFTIWDPVRCFSLQRVVRNYREATKDWAVQLWGYFAVDATGPQNLVGPAVDALTGYSRILCYGPWAARVVRESLIVTGRMVGEIPWLPHGLHDEPWFTESLAQRGSHYILAVGTNQARKDWGAVFGAFKHYQDMGGELPLFVHTDRDQGYWVMQQLIDAFGVAGGVTVHTEALREQELYNLYADAAYCINPGLGEGFGYVPAESAAAGRPCIQVDYAEGPTWASFHSLLETPITFRVDGVHALQRPVLYPPALAAKMLELEKQQHAGRYSPEVCRLSVLNLAWTILKPRWINLLREWVKGVTA